MVNMSQIWLVPAFPLLGFILNSILGKRFGTRFVSIVNYNWTGFCAVTGAFFQMLNTDGKFSLNISTPG